MEASFGKLLLIQPNAPDQEFELGKSSIHIGRSLTNDIVLDDGRVSREHARLECGPAGCTLIDLGSSNGTRLNGLRVGRAVLKAGDVIGIGTSQIRYNAAAAYDEVEMTTKYSDEDLETLIDEDSLPFSINETSIPRLVVFTSDKTWEVPLEDVDLLTIGRTDASQLMIAQAKVSRQHAEVVRKGNMFILRDLNSTNGTWHKGEPVGEMILLDGDAFRIGQAQIVFKDGFSGQALTMADEMLAISPERRPVVFVPGMMGSQLWLGNERVWPNMPYVIKNPEILRYSSSTALEPRGIVDEVVIVPNLVKMAQYNRLGDYLVEELSYERDVDFFEFAYDFREDVRLSARKLGALIENIPSAQPITIIAHSLGTMVSRYYIERLGGKQRVERAILMGGPHQGTLKIMSSMLVAPDMLPFGLWADKARSLVMSFPSCYQIVPTHPCGVDQDGVEINFYKDDRWLEEEYRPMMRAGRQFRTELGQHFSVPTLSIFGYGLKTNAKVRAQRNPEGRLSDLQFLPEPSGDDSILEKSAVLGGTDIHPVQQHHGSLFVDNDVKMRLKVELTRHLAK
jgi:pSer/pThr/pTyr-binding forkhead associated (FHA) protein